VKQRHEVQGNAGHLDTTTEKAVVQESGCTAPMALQTKRNQS
jgi:hypothetical protein